MRGAIREFLETRTPYRVCDEAGDGLSAIQKAEKSRCDLVLLDLAMPNLDGVETALVLRRTLPHVKIVGFSALAGDDALKDELLATKKFDAVLSKFEGLKKLADAINGLLSASADD